MSTDKETDENIKNLKIEKFYIVLDRLYSLYERLKELFPDETFADYLENHLNISKKEASDIVNLYISK